jgi:hypothetical protein
VYQGTFGGFRDNVVVKLNAAGSGLVFSTFAGGSSDDTASDIAVDNLNNVYVTGYGGAGMPVSTGAFQTNYAGGYDVFVYKLNPTASALIYGTYIGKSGADRPGTIVVDALHRVYINGTTTNTNFPVTTGAYATSNSGNVDMFVTKFDSTLSSLIYSTYLGGSGDDWANGLKVNTAGEAFLSGQVSSSFPVTTGAYDVSFNGGSSDACAVRLSAAGNALVYSTFIGTSGTDEGFDVEIDVSDNAWIVGYCANGLTTTACAFDNTYNGGNSDGFIIRLTPSGNAAPYVSYLGGSSDETGEWSISMLLDTLWIGGRTSSANFPTTSGAFDVSYNGGTADFVVAKISGNTTPVTVSGPTVICAGQTVTITASGATTYTWNTNSNSSSIVVSPTVTTTYVVSSSNSTCPGFAQLTLSVIPQPVAPAAIIGPTLVCSQASYFFQPAAGMNYSWTVPSGWSGSSTNSVLIATVTANGTLGVTAFNSCGTSTTTMLSVSHASLGPISTIAGPTVLCLPTVFSLTPVGGATLYQWTLFTGWTGTSTTNSILVTPATGTAVMFVTASGFCGVTSPATLSLLGNPPVTLSLTASASSVCLNDVITLTATGASTYTWSTGANGPAIVVTHTGATTYSAVGATSIGCTGTASIHVGAFPLPTVAVSSSTNALCQGLTATLTATGAQSYSWSTGSVSPQIVINAQNTATFSVTGTSSLGCSSAGSLLVTVFPLPSITITAIRSKICVGESTSLTALGALSYTWSNGATQPGTVVNPLTTSVYMVSAVDIYGCANTQTVTVTVDACTAIDALGRSDDILRVFPNPAKNVIFIEVASGGAQLISYIISDAGGKVVRIGQISERRTILELEDFATGNYIFEATKDGRRIARREFIKE